MRSRIITATFLLSALLSPLSYADLYQEALEYQRDGNPKAAIIQLKNLLQESPKHADGRLLLGQLHYSLGQPAEAEKEILQAIRLGKQDLDTVTLLIRSQLLQRKAQAADQTIQDYWPANQEAAERALLTGEIALQLNQLGEAENAFYQALELNNSANAKFGLAMVARQRGDLENALSTLESIESEDKLKNRVKLMQVELLLELQQPEPALIKLTELKRSQPENQILGLMEAHGKLLMGDFAASANALDALPKDYQQLPQYQLFAAMAAMGKNQFLESFQWAERLIQQQPDNLRALLIAGSAQYMMKDYGKAISYLEPFVSAVPGELNGRRLLAAAQQNLQKPQEALATLKPILTLEDPDAQSLAIAGYAELSLGNWEAGEKLLNQALEKDPNLNQLKDNIALSQILGGNANNAITELGTENDLKTITLKVMALVQQQEFDQAMALLQEQQQQQPEEAGLFGLQAAVYLKQGNTSKARESYQQALRVNDEFQPALLGLIRLDFAGKDLNAAEQHIEQLLRQQPDSLAGLMTKAMLAQAREQQSEFLQTLKEAAQKHPDALQPIAMMVNYYISKQDMDKARHQANSFYLNHPDNLDAKYLYATALQKSGEIQDAAVLGQQLVAKRPNNVNYLKLVVETLSDLGKLKEAEPHSQHLLNRAANDPAALFMHTNILLRQGKTDRAEPYAERLLKRAPSPLSNRVYGLLKLAQGQPETALEYLQAAAKGSIDGQLAVALSDTHAQLEQQQLSQQVLKDYLAAHPDDVPVTFKLAAMQQQLGDSKLAIELYEKLRTLVPDNPVPWNNLAWLYQQKGDVRSIDYARKALELAPERGDIKDTLAWILYEIGEYQEALGLMEDAIKQYPEHPEIQFHYAAVLLKAGQPQKGEDMLKSLANKPGPLQSQAQALLNEQ